MYSVKKFFLVISLLSIVSMSASNNAFDSDLYENVLDPELCEMQLTYIRNNASTLRTQFMDASWRVPRTISQGNTLDLGGYFECLAIDENILDTNIGGKYCMVRFPLEDFEIPTIPPFPDITWPETESRLKLPWEEINLKYVFTEEMKTKLKKFEETKQAARRLAGIDPEKISRSGDIGSMLPALNFDLAVCVPKACTTKQAIDFFTNNLTATMTFTDQFCRLPNDKTWVPADTIAVVLLSIIGLMIILSTAYDVRHTVILERDPKEANELLQSFSVFSNTGKFFKFPSGPNVVTCMDGVRSLSMVWIIVGHTLLGNLMFIPENVTDIVTYLTSFSSVWLVSFTIAVDTFFLLSGMLVVYTTAAKVTSTEFIKTLHTFILNRLLRMFPVLAFTILMTVSFLHRLADGPYFLTVEDWVNNCRNNWWISLLYVQNFVRREAVCLSHTWYLAADMQLYLISPLIIFLILGDKKLRGMIIVVASLVAVLVAATVYNFINNFQSNMISLQTSGPGDFHSGYYGHTLPRASPFFVGMVFGYLLHIYRGKRVKIPMVVNVLLWITAIGWTSYVVATHNSTVQPDWDNQTRDNLINTFHRPLWAAAVGWMIFSCHYGYGGPINWFLSLHIFKILARLSYAMYLLHYPLMQLIDGTSLRPNYFTFHFTMQRFFLDFTIALIAAFLVTVLIDMPCGNLIKMVLDGKRKKAPVQKTMESSDQKTEA